MHLNTYKITFKNLAYHLQFGLLPEEQTLGQRIYIDVSLYVDPNTYDCEDDITTVFDYRMVNDIIQSTVAEKNYKLLEHLAKRISSKLFQNRDILNIDITVRKPSVPLPTLLDYVEISMSYTNE